MEVKSFVEEGNAISYVSAKLGVSYSEAEQWYSDAGGFEGHSVNFDTRWPSTDCNPFETCILEFMAEKGLTSLQIQFDD